MNRTVVAIGIALAIAVGVFAIGFWYLGASREAPDSGGVFEGRPRFLLIGIDGLDWERVSRLVREGRMPNTEQLMAGGNLRRLLQEVR